MNGLKNLETYGVADETEKKLGTNPNKSDSDGDGHKDGTEVLNGFDPLKK